MTFTLGMTLTADAKGAKAELAATAGEAKKVTAATTEMGPAAKTAGAGAQVLAAGAQAATTATERLGNAEAAAAGKAVQMGRTHQLAAGQVGNLTAQFNDIGMMLMAGQNPLQLAIQQGTQITQVIGPMGAVGAVRALGGALMGMLNPVSLITMGAIAAGAAMVQWLTGTTEQALSADDAISAFSTSVSELRDISEGFSTEGIQGLIDKYGELTGEVMGFVAAQQRAAEAQAAMDAKAAFASIREELDGFEAAWKNLDQIFNVGVFAANDMILLLREAETATTFDGQLAAVSELRIQLEAATGGVAGMNAEQYAFYSNILQSEGALRQLVEQTKPIQDTLMDAATSAWDFAKNLLNGEDAAQRLAATSKSINLANANAGAAGLVSKLGMSLQLATALAGLGLGENGPSLMDDGRGSQREGRSGAYDFRSKQAVTAANTRVAEYQRSLSGGSPPNGGGRGGGGSSAINAERDAMAELIAKEQLELDILRESDPVQKELLRHREAMKTATGAEKVKLEELITARLAEKDAAEAAKGAWSMLADGATTVLDGILFKSKSVGDAVREMARTIIQAAGQAFLTGGGPLAGLFGITGGLFGGGGGAKIPLFAGGGLLDGPGTGTSDSMLMYGSTGEFMVNAKSTARHLPLLEAINAGAPLPRFARGGRIGGGTGASGTGGGRDGAGPIEMHIHVNNARGNSEIKDMIEQGVGQALTTYDREVVPARFAQISRDPGKVG